MSPTADALGLGGWYAAALALSALLVPACRRQAIRFGYVAPPQRDRWHKRPTALFGGVAIVFTVLALSAIGVDVAKAAPLIGAGALIFIVGVVDDILPLKPSTKLTAEIAIASVREHTVGSAAPLTDDSGGATAPGQKTLTRLACGRSP